MKTYKEQSKNKLIEILEDTNLKLDNTVTELEDLEDYVKGKEELIENLEDFIYTITGSYEIPKNLSVIQVSEINEALKNILNI